jgi:hypothetical protein
MSAAASQASPELVVMLETERAMRDHYNRTFARMRNDDKAEYARSCDATRRRARVWRAAERFPSASLADLALKASAMAGFYEGCDKTEAFTILVADIERLVKGGAS